MLNKFKVVMKWILIVYVSIASIIWLVSPLVASHFIQNALEELDVRLGNETSIYYNPFIHHLTIHDLALYQKSQDEPSLVLKSLNAEVRLYQLLFDTVYISEFDIDGLTIAVDINEQGNTVAGFKLPAEQVENADDTEAQLPEEELPADTTAAPLAYRVALPQFNLTNAEINIQINEQAHKIKFNRLGLSDLSASMTEQSLNVVINSEINDAPLLINALIELNNQQGQINLDFALTRLNLNRFQGFLPKPEDKLAGDLSLNFNSLVNIDEQQKVSLTIKDHVLLLENLALAYQDYQLSLVEQKVQAENTQINILSPDNITVSSKASYFIKQLLISVIDEEQALASFESLTIPNINVSNEADVANYQISLADLKLTSLLVSDNLADDVLPLTRLSDLHIDTIELDQQSVAIGQVLLSDLVVKAELDEEKQLVNLIPLPTDEAASESQVDEKSETTPQQDSEAKPVATEVETTPAFNFSLASFALATPATIDFHDRSIKPNYHHNFVINTFTVSKLDSQQPALTSEIVLKGKSNEYEHFDFTAHITPFNTVPTYQLVGHFKEVNLPDISSYIKDALQFEIDSGHFDLALDVNVKGTELSGDADVLLRKVEFKVLEQDEEKVTKTSVPFNVALGMLKDSDGNVELNLPLTGDINDPSFGFSGLLTLLVKQATMSAAKDYLITTFVPYAQVVKIAMSAGEFALKVRVEDLVYPVTKIDLQPEQQEFLDQFAALLKDKDDLEFKLCPISTPEDIGLPLGKKLDNAKQNEELHSLSVARVKTFKNYMINNHNIASSRLLICKARIDTSKDAKPRITFAI